MKKLALITFLLVTPMFAGAWFGGPDNSTLEGAAQAVVQALIDGDVEAMKEVNKSFGQPSGYMINQSGEAYAGRKLSEFTFTTVKDRKCVLIESSDGKIRTEMMFKFIGKGFFFDNYNRGDRCIVPKEQKMSLAAAASYVVQALIDSDISALQKVNKSSKFPSKYMVDQFGKQYTGHKLSDFEFTVLRDKQCTVAKSSDGKIHSDISFKHIGQGHFFHGYGSYQWCKPQQEIEAAAKKELTPKPESKPAVKQQEQAKFQPKPQAEKTQTVLAKAKDTNPEFDIAGKWQTKWGIVTFDVSGSEVTGSYPHDSGKITGVISGNTLKGNWSEGPSFAPPKDAGEFEFTFSSANKFTGKWRYGSSGTWRSGWNGVKQ